MTQDIADMNALGILPVSSSDLIRRAEPVTVKAKEKSEDIARIHFDDELMREAAGRAHTVVSNDKFITTGHYQVDEDTGGFQKEFVWLIGADTSWGKSSHLILCTIENLNRGHRALIVSWEDSEKLYADRILAKRAQVSARRFKNHRRGLAQLTGEELSRINRVVQDTPHRPLFLDARGRSAEWVARQLKAIIAQEGIDLVGIDYLQAGNNEKRQDDRRNQIAYIHRICTDAIKTAGAAGVIYSQITVDEKKLYPDRHSAKEGRDSANSAEVVAMGFDAKKPRKAGGVTWDEGDKLLFVDKVKDGPPRQVHKMNWNKDVACFDAVTNPTISHRDYFDNL